MKIIHFSDAHAGGPAEDWLAYLDKRWVGVFNFNFRRKFQHDLSMLEKTVTYVLDVKPDLAVCTGDITSTGQPGEFEKALKILAPLRDSQIPFIFIPGNHDCYVRHPKCVNAMKSAVRYLNRNRIDFDALPSVIKIGQIEFIIVNESFPTNLLSSCGYLRKNSADFIKRICSSNKTCPRVLIGHYPLFEDHPLLRIRHRLWGQKDVLNLLKDGKIDLSLCGHVHFPNSRINERGRGEICAGSVTRNASIAIIDYDDKKDIFNCENFSLKI
ncbi:MAG: hypothetical protein A2017_03215 [Lentisphaerae bacterium GWF2_44_16]|nr:MAG: hypothetical protein A2017_03215 [Lentisphaerae bacterium GWF2_44_16]